MTTTSPAPRPARQVGERLTATVPGVLDYQALATLHRPTDPAALATEIRRMTGRGLTPRDVSMHLGIALAVVVDTLRTNPDQLPGETP